MLKTQQIGFGDYLATIKQRFINRTGGTVLKGTPVMTDLAQSHSEVDTTEPGSGRGVNANVIACTQVGIDHGRSVVVAADDVLDGKSGFFYVCGPNIDIRALSDANATTNLAAGLGIRVLVSDSAVAAQGAAAGSRILGQWYEAGASTGDPVLKKGQWTGGIPSLGCNIS
jgi:hypothetical protein